MSTKIEGEFSLFIEEKWGPLQRHVFHLSDEFNELKNDYRRRVTDVESKIILMEPKVNEIHQALFHPEKGLVNIKEWICKLWSWTWAIIGGILFLTASVVTTGHNLGWW